MQTEWQNSVDPDQTAPGLGLHCLLRPICPKLRIITVTKPTFITDACLFVCVEA